MREVAGSAFGQVVRSRPLLPAWGGDWLTLLSCMFLHGGWLHFLGNMLFRPG